MSNQSRNSLVNAAGENHTNLMETPHARRNGKTYSAAHAVVAMGAKSNPFIFDSGDSVELHGMNQLAMRYGAARLDSMRDALEQVMKPGTPPPGGTPPPPDSGPAVIPYSPFSPTFHPLYAARPEAFTPWCNVHERAAWHFRKDGSRCCDPKLGGIMLPCSVVLAPMTVDEDSRP